MSEDESESIERETDDTFTERGDKYEKNLITLALEQEKLTNSVVNRLIEYFKLSFLGKTNKLEEFILSTEPNDSSLIAKYSKITEVDLSKQQSISVDSLVLSTLHIPHPLINFIRNEGNKQQWESLGLSSDLENSPILVFIHGLGGQMSQFEPLISLLSQCSEIVSLDLPGFGNSKLKFDNKFKMVSNISNDDKERISKSILKMNWNDFHINNIVNIIYEFILQNIPESKKIILIGHSMGTHLSVKLSKRLPKHKIEGLILLSMPKLFNDIDVKQSPPNIKKSSILYAFTFIPSLFRYFRVWDRLPGLNSTSVIRQMVHNGPNNIYNKLRQFRWNLDVNSEIILKYVHGFQSATYSELIQGIKQYNDNPQDKRIYKKTLFLCGDKDLITPPKLSKLISGYLSEIFDNDISFNIEIPNAGHSLLLIKPEYTSGKILNFIETNFPERLHLSPSWVLKIKAIISGDKWGLKNELKWLQLKPISLNIRRGNEISPILAMKTLRQEDSIHSPEILETSFYGGEQKYKDIKGKLVAIIDISADSPPYDPKSFKHIKYYKYSTVSKVVPDQIAIRGFIHLIDKILKGNEGDGEGRLIAVHCHYGFNRTGFLLCCYLIERLGWSVKDAVEAFRAAKPPGIKHQHFVDSLFVKYEQ